MKIGMCVNAGLDKIEFAAKCGFDYIEYRFAHLTDSSDEEFSALCHCLQENNILCESVNCFIPAHFNLLGDKLDYKGLSEYIERGMKRGLSIGLKTVVFGSGKARSVPEGMSYAEAFRQLTYFLKNIVAPIAEKYSITVVIEPLSLSDSNFINTAKQGVMLAAAANSESIKGLVDFYHMSNMNDSCQNIIDLKGCIHHAHVAEPLTRATPTLGTEDTYREFFAALRTAGCERCSIEATHKDFFAEIADGLSVLRNI